MLHKVVHFLRGLRAWRFLLRLAVSKNNVAIGLQAAKLVAVEILRDPAAQVRHGHGREGCDIQGTQGGVEVKLKMHLLSNRNRVVDVNVAAYRRRKSPDRGLLLAVPVLLAESIAGHAPPAGDGKMLNMPVEVLILVVTMTHETGEKPLVTAADIIATAKQALAKEFPGRAFEEMDREELVAMLQVQGMQALDAQMEEFRAEIEAKVGTVEAKVDQLARDLGAIKNILERLTRK